MSDQDVPADDSAPSHEPGAVITVGVFAHNHAAFVRECILSVTGDADLRIVIVDDASSDDTPQEILAAAAALESAGYPVEVQLDTVNRGFVARLNNFLDKVDTEYFCLLSGDDRFTPGGLSVMRDAAVKQPGADVVFAAYERIDAEGELLEPAAAMAEGFRRRLAYVGTPKPAFDELLSYGSFVPGGCTLVRSGFVQGRGARFNEDLANAEDYDFWLELGPDCRYLFVDEHAWDYRVLATSKYHSAGSRRLRCELAAIGRHRKGAPTRVRALSVVQAAHRAKRQWVKAPADSGVPFVEVAQLVQTPRWALAAGTCVAVIDSLGGELGRRLSTAREGRRSG